MALSAVSVVEHGVRHAKGPSGLGKILCSLDNLKCHFLQAAMEHSKSAHSW